MAENEPSDLIARLIEAGEAGMGCGCCSDDSGQSWRALLEEIGYLPPASEPEPPARPMSPGQWAAQKAGLEAGLREYGEAMRETLNAPMQFLADLKAKDRP